MFASTFIYRRQKKASREPFTQISFAYFRNTTSTTMYYIKSCQKPFLLIFYVGVLLWKAYSLCIRFYCDISNFARNDTNGMHNAIARPPCKTWQNTINKNAAASPIIFYSNVIWNQINIPLVWQLMCNFAKKEARSEKLCRTKCKWIFQEKKRGHSVRISFVNSKRWGKKLRYACTSFLSHTSCEL